MGGAECTCEDRWAVLHTAPMLRLLHAIRHATCRKVTLFQGILRHKAVFISGMIAGYQLLKRGNFPDRGTPRADRHPHDAAAHRAIHIALLMKSRGMCETGHISPCGDSRPREADPCPKLRLRDDIRHKRIFVGLPESHQCALAAHAANTALTMDNSRRPRRDA